MRHRGGSGDLLNAKRGEEPGSALVPRKEWHNLKCENSVHMSEKHSANIVEQAAQGVVEFSSPETQFTQLDTDLSKGSSILMFKYLQCSSDHDPKKMQQE